MKRRSLLGFIGAGAAVAATGAAALPRVASPVDLAKTGGREVSAKGLFIFENGTLYLDKVNTGIIYSSDPISGVNTVTITADKFVIHNPRDSQPFIPSK